MHCCQYHNNQHLRNRLSQRVPIVTTASDLVYVIIIVNREDFPQLLETIHDRLVIYKYK